MATILDARAKKPVYEPLPDKDSFINRRAKADWKYRCEPSFQYQKVNAQRKTKMRQCIESNDALSCNSASRLWKDLNTLVSEFYRRNPMPDSAPEITFSSVSGRK